jgi:archaeal type IV pilus assembly protein PilA
VRLLSQIRLKRGEDAVSPVVGVMLMLVVTIIIAAIVSGYSGGLLGGTNQQAPTLSMDITITESESGGVENSNGGFSATVTGVSQPIQTSRLKLVTSWSTKDREDGSILVGGNTTVGTPLNVYTAGTQGPSGTSGYTTMISDNAPFGFGPGVNGTPNIVAPYLGDQQFGNYTLMAGTGLKARNEDGSGFATQVLGGDWDNLKVGDVVTVNVIYVPNGKVILNKEVAVTA